MAIIMQNRLDKTCPIPITLTLLNIQLLQRFRKDNLYSAPLPYNLRPGSLLRIAIGSERP